MSPILWVKPQGPLQRRRGQARHKAGKVLADEPGDLGPDRCGRFRIAAGALLDDALDHRDHERDPGGLDRLEIDRGQQPRPIHRSPVRQHAGEDRIERPQGLAFSRAQRCGRIGALAQLAHGGEVTRDVEDALLADCDHGQTTLVGEPDAPGKSAAAAVSGEGGRAVEQEAQWRFSSRWH
jgi:hypothetical protein